MSRNPIDPLKKFYHGSKSKSKSKFKSKSKSRYKSKKTQKRRIIDKLNSSSSSPYKKKSIIKDFYEKLNKKKNKNKIKVLT
jgi:hypothetical protein